MSTDHRPLTDIPWDDFWTNLPAGLSEHVTEETDPTHRIVTDGTNYMHVFGDPGGLVHVLTKFGGNNVYEHIVPAIEEHYNTQLIDEHDPQYYEDDDYTPDDIRIAVRDRARAIKRVQTERRLRSSGDKTGADRYRDRHAGDYHAFPPE